MANSYTSPNMSLVVPVVGVDPGPDWASNLNASLTILDTHNHAPGSGVPITPAGLNISSDLSFLANNATMLRSSRYVNGSVLSAATDVGCIFVSGGNLYYNNTGGTAVQITSGSSVNAGAGSITGLPSGTASVTFSASTYVFQSATATPASLDAGSLIIRNTTASANGITLAAPAALGSNYGLVLPAIPAQTNVMTLDNSGNMASITYDAVGQGMSATGSNAISAVRTRSTGTSVGVGGVAISASCGAFSSSSSTPAPVTNLSVTIATSGRPVFVGLIPDGSVNDSVYNTQVGVTARIYILQGGSQISQTFVSSNSAAFSVSSLSVIAAVTAGTYTFSVYFTSASGNLSLFYAKLVAYEL